MPRLTLVLGGSRSGKSRFAQGLPAPKARVVYWATGLATDKEMARRIAVHRAMRPRHWGLLEEPLDLCAGLQAVRAMKAPIVVLDSLTSWVGNLQNKGSAGGTSLDRLNAFLEGLSCSKADWIIVSDEVGMGVIPATAMGRAFKDLLGDVNQRVAASADRVYCLHAGIPVQIK